MDALSAARRSDQKKKEDSVKGLNWHVSKYWLVLSFQIESSKDRIKPCNGKSSRFLKPYRAESAKIVDIDDFYLYEKYHAYYRSSAKLILRPNSIDRYRFQFLFT